MNWYLDRNRPLRLATLCVLYAAQGMPDGFVRIALKTYLISEGASVSAIGNVIAMVSWPWAMKWVWGPFIDRYGYAPMGRRRPWILAAQLSMVTTLLAMLLVPDVAHNLPLLALMVLLVNIFASMQDVAVDALAVDLLPERERGVANGFMFGSNYAASFLGGVVLGQCILLYGFSTAITLQVSLLLLIVAFPLFLRERPSDVFLPKLPYHRAPGSSHESARPSSLKQVFGMLWKAFSLRSTRLAALLAILSLITINGHLVIWPTYVQRQLGWTASEWLTIEGGYAVLFGVGGSVAGGLIASAIGARRTVLLSLAAVAACWFAYAFWEVSWADKNVVTALFLAETAAAGLLQVSMFALFMGLCWPPIAATQFTAYMALLNLSNGLGAILADQINASFSMPAAHILLGILQVPLVFIVLMIDPNETRQKLGDSVAEEKNTAPSPASLLESEGV